MLTIDWFEIQRKLKVAGHYHGPIDGIRGPLTDGAITSFKISIGLRARPYVGRLTFNAIMALPAPEPRTGFEYLDIARAMLGIHEARNTKRLRAWFTATVDWIDPRVIAWCGAFIETCLHAWGEDFTVENPLGARNWLKYGKACTPQLGSILVFWRGSIKGWKGHVGFYWGEDATHFYVLGGNQSNAVTISRIRKSRLLGARIPYGVKRIDKRVFMKPGGVPVTNNEA